MTNRFWTGMVIMLVFTGLILTASCAKKEVKLESTVTQSDIAEEEEEARDLVEENACQEAIAAQKALEEKRLLEEERLREEAKEREELAARDRFLEEAIHFEFDKSRLISEAKETLRFKAEWLMAHPDVKVIIGGHCDERGTSKHNMALGSQRAESANVFLVHLGIEPERLSNISYGEEKPLDPDHNEEAWAKNRRVHFIID